MSNYFDNGGYIGASAKYDAFQGITTQGLQLFLDAGNPISYPGFGTRWTNLANRNLNATLNGTSYTNNAGGGIVFGSGNTATVPSGLTISGIGSGYTISVWIRHTGTVSVAREQRYFNLENQAAILTKSTDTASNLQAYYLDSSGVTRGLVNVSNMIFTENYYNLVSVCNGTSMVVYRNGVQVGSVSIGLTGSFRTPSTVTLSDSSRYFEGSMHIVKYYTRALSAIEVSRNYTALCGRFGL